MRIWRTVACAWTIPVSLSSWAANAGDSTPESAAASILDAVELGGHLELSYEDSRNLDLDGSQGDDLGVAPVELEVEARFEPNETFLAYLRSQLRHQFVVHEDGSQETDTTDFLINEAYVTVTDPDLGLSLQLGRQLFEDERQWLYDAELDAVRGRYEDSNLLIELSASGKALIVDEDLLNGVEKESTADYILYGAYFPNEHLTEGVYAIIHKEQNNSSTRTIFLGVTSNGTPVQGLSYWADAALLRGKDQGTSLRGYGVDILGAYQFDASLSPRIIAGFAYGSGNSDNGRDTGFRQTGLQDDESELGALASFKYYGEAFDPELANMLIYTAGIGVRPRDDLTMDLIYHRYRQDVPSEKLRNSALDVEPTGESRALGSEIDFVLGFEATDQVLVSGLLGYFLPGRAFAAESDNALIARIKFEFGF